MWRFLPRFSLCLLCVQAFPVSVQNGSLHQKDTVHDNDFEPYLTGQSNQVGKKTCHFNWSHDCSFFHCPNGLVFVFFFLFFFVE